MNNKERLDSLQNRAFPQDSENINCSECFESVIFHMKDNDHDFSMGLTTILECIAFAIKNGDLPKLPLSWLSDVDFRYNTDYAFDKELSYGDSNFPRKCE